MFFQSLRHPQSFDVDKHEWLCPMCDCICNAALPMALPLHKLYPITTKLTEEYVVKVLQPIASYAEGKSKEASSVEEMETSQEQVAAAAAAVQKKADLSPDIIDAARRVPPPPVPPAPVKKEVPEEMVSQAELSDRIRACFPPRSGYFPVPIPTERKQDHSLSYRVWLRGMEIMNRFSFTQTNHPDELDSDDAAEVGEDQEIPNEGPFQNSIFTRKLIKRLFRRGLPGERLLEIFHGHIYSDHQETSNWLHAKFYDKLLNFMERVQTVACDKIPEEPDRMTYQLHRTLWHSLAYTIMSAEAYHRDQKISFFGENVPIRRSMGLKFLTRVCSVAVDSQFFSTCWVSKTSVLSEFLIIVC